MAGDVNGDGYGDFLVGAFGNNGGGASNKGIAYVFYGSSSGVITRALSNLPYACSSTADCSVFQNPQNEAGGRFGETVSAAGDLNADGFADVISAAYSNTGSGAANKGAAYVYYGKQSGITNHPGSAIPYTCGGFPDCTPLQNPENEASGNFGYGQNGVGYLAPPSPRAPQSSPFFRLLEAIRPREWVFEEVEVG